MTTHLLFRDDPYLREAEATVLAHTPEGGIVLDATIFYATAGGQPGDSGMILWPGGRMPIATAVKVEGGLIALVPADATALPICSISMSPGTGIANNLRPTIDTSDIPTSARKRRPPVKANPLES